MTLPSITGGCVHCGTGGYQGLHGTACPRYSADLAGVPMALRTLPAPASYELCEKCATVLVERNSCFEREATGFKRREMFPRQTLKKVGEPCHVCGNAAPQGTYPWQWPVTVRIGEHTPYSYIHTKPARKAQAA